VSDQLVAAVAGKRVEDRQGDSMAVFESLRGLCERLDETPLAEVCGQARPARRPGLLQPDGRKVRRNAEDGP
jgi:hypothetical protein